jgi:hypothetical protein
MRKLLFHVTLGAFIVGFGPARALAQHHEHPAPAQSQDAKEKMNAEAQKKDPNRKKPENQPGAVMDAEKLAASHADHHEMPALENGGSFADGWKYRFDLTNMKAEHARLLETGATLHLTSGPPGIYYNPSMTAGGEYAVKGTFTQLAKGEHREGYGPFVGGADLDGNGQRYTYFLVRQDGKFLIKQRAGVNTKGVTDWTTHSAIKAFGDDGKMTNELAIVVGADTVRFLINGVEVDRKPRAALDTDGVVGIRANHGLDITVDNLSIERVGTR